MHTKKGYIAPVVLIVLLLTLAGVFLFTQKPAESPVAEKEDIVAPATTTPVLNRQNNQVPAATTSEAVEDEQKEAVITSTTTLEVEIE